MHDTGEMRWNSMSIPNSAAARRPLWRKSRPTPMPSDRFRRSRCPTLETSTLATARGCDQPIEVEGRSIFTRIGSPVAWREHSSIKARMSRWTRRRRTPLPAHRAVPTTQQCRISQGVHGVERVRGAPCGTPLSLFHRCLPSVPVAPPWLRPANDACLGCSEAALSYVIWDN